MKAKVVKAYRDKHDGRVHLEGEELDLPAPRAKELESLKHVETSRSKARKTDREAS